eukprot:m51a1_g4576 hypothetical protein (439) ;mRNA; f:162015-163681
MTLVSRKTAAKPPSAVEATPSPQGSPEVVKPVARSAAYQSPAIRTPEPRSPPVDLKDSRWEIVFNITLVMVAFYLMRTCLDYYEKTGKLLDLSLLEWLVGGWRLVVVACISACAATFTALFWVLVAAQRKMPALRYPCHAVYCAAQAILLTTPVWVLNVLIPDYTPLHGASVATQMIILVTKMHSFYFTECNTTLVSPKARCPSLGSFISFLFFPTLCYVPEGLFPRTDRIRWRYVFEMTGVCCASLFVAYTLMAHEILPHLKTVAEVGFLKTLIRTGLPTFGFYVLFFFGLFHAFFEIVSEIMRFGERRTYGEWWTIRDWGQFWKLWNYRVHEWLVRHIFLGSMTDIKAPRGVAFLLSFVISGLLHEYLIWVAFRKLQFWILTVLIVQTLFMAVVRGFIGNAIGNMLLWIGLHIGPNTVMIMITYSVTGKLSQFKLF